MKLCEYISRKLRQLGCEQIFGVPGYCIMPLWQELEDNPRIIMARHESGAVFMADGYARITNRLGVVIGTIGPGLTNMITGIACAYKDSIPMLVITGQNAVASLGSGAFQECYEVDRGFSQIELSKAITKASFEILNIETAVCVFEQAIHQAISGRKGPVHLSIPIDIQSKELPQKEEVLFESMKSVSDIQHEICISEDCRQQIDAMRRPLILAGWGCYISNSMEKLNELSLKLAAPIITSIKGISNVSSLWDWSLGHVGNGQNKHMIEFLKEYDPDGVLILGCSLSSYYIAPIIEILKNAYCIQVDIEGSQLGLHLHPNRMIQGDVNEWILSALTMLADKSNPKLLGSVKEFKMKKEEINEQKNRMASMIDVLNTVLPENSTVIPDAGNHWLDTLSIYRSKSVCGLMTNSGHASMGHAIGAAIGIKIGAPSRTTVCITGDGSALMSGNEISVSVEQGLNTIFVIFNNESMGRVRSYQELFCDRNYVASDIPNINFTHWAQGLGAEAIRVGTVDEFERAIKEAVKSTKTTVIEALVPRTELPLFLKNSMTRR